MISDWVIFQCNKWPLFLLFFTSATNPDFRFKVLHAIHLIPAPAIAYQFLSGAFIVNIDYSIIASFATYAVWTATTLTRNVSAVRELDPRTNSAIKWMIGLASVLGIYAVGEVLIYVDLIRWPSLPDSGSFQATLSFYVIVSAVVIFAALQRSSPLDWLISTSGHHSRMTPICDAEIDDILTRLATLVRSDGFFEADGQSLTAVARKLSISTRSLSESIRRAHGHSFLQFMNRQRVSKAMEILDSSSNRSIIDVMMDSGFRTKSTFNKIFKDIQGQTPTEYRDINGP